MNGTTRTRRRTRTMKLSGSASGSRGSEEGASIPVVEEELQVGKRAVKRGGVRVYSHVVEKPVEENIELREEHVNVERVRWIVLSAGATWRG